MESKQMDAFIKKAMDTEAMNMTVPGPELVSAARHRVISRKKVQPKESNWLGLFAFVRHHLKFYQVGVSVLVTCLCLFYSIEINVQSRGGHNMGNYNVSALSIKNTTISVNSSTLLTSIPTLRN